MEKRSRRRIRDLVAHPASQGLDANENRCARISMMARSANAPLKGRIQKRKTNNLQIITSGLQRTAGPYRCANNGHNAYQTLPPLEPLGASLTLRIGKIAIERKADILHQGVDAKMIALGRLAALSHMVEGPVKLRQVFDCNH